MPDQLALDVADAPAAAPATSGRLDRLLTGPEWWARWDAIADRYDGELDARRVPCPKCGAPVGVKCRRPSGHNAWEAHAERWDEALYDAEHR